MKTTLLPTCWTTEYDNCTLMVSRMNEFMVEMNVDKLHGKNISNDIYTDQKISRYSVFGHKH